METGRKFLYKIIYYINYYYNKIYKILGIENNNLLVDRIMCNSLYRVVYI